MCTLELHETYTRHKAIKSKKKRAITTHNIFYDINPIAHLIFQSQPKNFTILKYLLYIFGLDCVGYYYN